jgi:hypothetical protein
MVDLHNPEYQGKLAEGIKVMMGIACKLMAQHSSARPEGVAGAGRR